MSYVQRFPLVSLKKISKRYLVNCMFSKVEMTNIFQTKIAIRRSTDACRGGNRSDDDGLLRRDKRLSDLRETG